MRNPKLKLKPKEVLIIAIALSVAIAFLAGMTAFLSGFGIFSSIIVFVFTLFIVGGVFYCAHIRLHKLLLKRLSDTSFFQNRVSWDSEDTVSENQTKETNLPVTESTDKILSFSEMLILDESQKQILLSKIRTYMNKGVKGKAVALMINALRKLGYLSFTASNRSLYIAIQNEFKVDFGTERGFQKFLEPQQIENFKNEIESTMEIFRLD
jgi:predicted RNA binding protein with dsRBD fold (UPF0201 family)